MAEVSQLSTIDHPMLTCWPVLTEAFWMLPDRPAATQNLLRSFGEDGLLPLATLNEDDLPGIARILQTYASLRPQLAAAALSHLAEREGLRAISLWIAAPSRSIGYPATGRST
jgi:uncharacterized protein